MKGNDHKWVIDWGDAKDTFQAEPDRRASLIEEVEVVAVEEDEAQSRSSSILTSGQPSSRVRPAMHLNSKSLKSVRSAES